MATGNSKIDDRIQSKIDSAVSTLKASSKDGSIGKVVLSLVFFEPHESRFFRKSKKELWNFPISLNPDMEVHDLEENLVTLLRTRIFTIITHLNDETEFTMEEIDKDQLVYPFELNVSSQGKEGGVINHLWSMLSDA